MMRYGDVIVIGVCSLWLLGCGSTPQPALTIPNAASGPILKQSPFVHCGNTISVMHPVVIDATTNRKITLSVNAVDYIAVSDDCAQGVRVTIEPPDALTILATYPDTEHTVLVRVQVNAPRGQLELTSDTGTTRTVEYGS